MKVAVLGAGAIGEDAIKELLEMPEIEQVVAYDIREERIRELENKYAIKGTCELDQIMDDRDITLVYVASSNASHRDLAVASINASKAVLCEKPIANTLEEAREIVELAESKKSFLQIGFELRYSKLYMKIKEWIDAGLLGEIVSTHCRYCSSAYKKDAWRNSLKDGGSTFGERTSHYVDLTRWWIGSEVNDVYSACAPNVVPYTEVRDNYETTYRFKSGAVSHLSYSMNYAATFDGDALQINHTENKSVTDLQLGDGHNLQYIIVGTKGAAETDVFLRQIKRWQFSDTPDVMKSEWTENLTWKPEEDRIYYHNGTHQLQDVVHRVMNGLPPMTPARDAYETMRLCFAADQSSDSGQLVNMDQIK